jgi:cytochrome c oxidase subunit 2
MHIFSWPSSLWVVLEAVNRVYRTILLLPPQASAMAGYVDALHYFEITIYTVIAILFMGTTTVFLIRYRRRSSVDNDSAEVRAPGLVGLYACGMFGLFFVCWVLGEVQYTRLRTPPAEALDVYVTGKQWTWKFAYTQGGASVDVLYVPVGRPVRLLLTSRDVIHSFWVPAFRIKQDAVPGTYTSMWFSATQAGAYQVMCAQMCGPGHSRMWAQVVALDEGDYAKWRAGTPPPTSRASIGLLDRLPGDRAPDTPVTPAEEGRVAAATFACLKCHTTDGQPHIGPTWLGLYGSQELLQDGTRVTVDEAYITRSMMDPALQIVHSFKPVMPSYQGLITPADTAAIIEFMKTLRDARQPRVVAPMPAQPIDGIVIRPREARP